MALDPVCGMTVDPAKAAGSFDYHGTMYFFCGKGCLAKFSADPEKFLSGHREPMGHHAPPQIISLGRLKKSLTWIALRSIIAKKLSCQAGRPVPSSRPITVSCPT